MAEEIAAQCLNLSFDSWRYQPGYVLLHRECFLWWENSWFSDKKQKGNKWPFIKGVNNLYENFWVILILSQEMDQQILTHIPIIMAYCSCVPIGHHIQFNAVKWLPDLICCEWLYVVMALWNINTNTNFQSERAILKTENVLSFQYPLSNQATSFLSGKLTASRFFPMKSTFDLQWKISIIIQISNISIII